MRATSERRKQARRGRAAPPLAPVKHREAGTVQGRVVERIPLHPDHEITADRADALGLVTRAQVARTFGVSTSTSTKWSHSASFPARRARLMVGMGRPGMNADLFDRREVVAWIKEFQPKYIRRAKRVNP